MRTIHLLRHAKSSWDDDALADVDRPLAPRGERDAKRLGQALAEEGFEVDVVLVSPARRARDTWASVASALASAAVVREEPRLFEASADAIRDVIATTTRLRDRVLVVAHNPGIEALVDSCAYPADTRESDLSRTHVPTCTLVTLAFDRALTRGRVERAIRARGGRIETGLAARAPTATSARRVVVDPGATRRDAASHVIDAVREHVLANVRGAEDGDPESVHQLRVALRRARVAVWAFRRELEPGSRRLRIELRDLGRALAPLRDVHVLRDTVRASDPGRPLMRAIEAETSLCEHDARLALRGRRGRAALDALRELAPRDGASTKPVGRLAGRRIARRAAAVLDLWPAIDGVDLTALHAIRKELKKLRYAVAMLSPRDADPVGRALAAAQDVLGAAQDRASAIRLFDERLAPRIDSARRAAARVELERSLPRASSAVLDFSDLRAILEALTNA